jgi:hypothetical protein
MFPEYEEFMDYIQSPDVCTAFEYLIEMTRELPDYHCAPNPHGYIKRNLWYRKNQAGLFAFTVARKHLLFYFRNPRFTHPGLNLDALKIEFSDAEEKNNGEFKMHVRTLDDAKRVMKVAFDIQTAQSVNEINAEFERKVFASAHDIQLNRLNRLSVAETHPKTTTATTTVFNRNPDVVAETLFRANGICERCNKPAPFKRRTDGSPYLEVHHVIALADGGEDSVKNAIALCPNCHREKHYG